MRFFATALPGLGPVLRDELRALPDASSVGRPAGDGRADVVVFDHPAAPGSLDVRTAEDVFVEVSAAPRTGDPHTQAAALLDGPRLERALSAFATLARPLLPRMSYRVAVRVSDEGDFRRTDLRKAVHRAVAEMRPRWRQGDPAHIELWVLQLDAEVFRLGLRLTGAERSRRTTRTKERPGALRPSVAAAMVRLAGPPPQDPTLLDPCCGSGTILIEAEAAGWEPAGSDIEGDAVDMARANAPDVPVSRADATRLPHPDGSLAAIVSNLPFGTRFEVPRGWTAAFAAEAARTVRTGGPVVLLAPASSGLRAALGHVPIALERSFDITLLGARTTLWVLRRT
ncbi:MAG TPA: methyltransferase domain-containing protein [Actinomycetota bacterium]|nr:methyltransferase domain-containing protein [Actinomycetota bacterium]